MTINISQRPAKIANLNLRPELHGDERRQAIDIKLEDIPIDPTDLGQILGDHEASNRLYVQRDSRLEPAFPHLEALKVSEKIEGATVLIAIGLQKQKPLRFEDCNLAKVTIELRPGGVSSLTVTVQTLPALTKELLSLIGANGGEVDVEIYVSQQELPIGKVDEAQAEAARRLDS